MPVWNVELAGFPPILIPPISRVHMLRHHFHDDKTHEILVKGEEPERECLLLKFSLSL